MQTLPDASLNAAAQRLEGYLVAHKFSVGQSVDLVPRILRAAAPGQYEVRQLMPQSDRDTGDPSYRIKSIDEKHERAVFESDLSPSGRSQFLARCERLPVRLGTRART